MAAWQAVVRTYYALTGLWTLAASLIWGVNTLFLLDAGLTIMEAFAANAAFTAGQVLFEVPTGMVADTRGRRFSFLLAVVTLMVGTLWYVQLAAAGAGFWWWAAASVLLGLGFTFFSGAVDAWFVDALAATGGPEELDGFFARAAQLMSAGMLVGAVAGGLLGDIHLSYPYVARTALLALALGVGYAWMRDQGFDGRPFRVREVPHEVARLARASIEHGWKVRPVRLLMVLTFLHMGFLIWGWYAWQPYFLQLLGSDQVWVAGVIAASVSAAMVVGNQAVRMLRGRIPRPTLIVVGSTVLPLAMLGVGLVDSFYPAVALFLVGMVGFGMVMPAKQAAFHRLIPSRQRATITSFDGLLGSAGGVGSQLALARIAQDRGFAAGYVVGAGALALGIPVAAAFRRIVPRVDPPRQAAQGPQDPS